MKYVVPLMLGLCMLAPAQQPKEAQSAKPDCKAMMTKMQKHRDGMKQMDDKLKADLEAMKKASGEAKVEAMAEVVTTLAQQRIQMHERMMSMDEDSSRHTMGHMQQGRAGMADCPMMSGRSPSAKQ